MEYIGVVFTWGRNALDKWVVDFVHFQGTGTINSSLWHIVRSEIFKVDHRSVVITTVDVGVFVIKVLYWLTAC